MKKPIPSEMEGKMEIKVSQALSTVPVTVIHLEGELDGSSYEAFEAQAEQLIGSGSRNLLIDMSKVTFLSSAGIRAINYIFNCLRKQEGGEDETLIAAGLRDGTYKSRRLKLSNLSKQAQKALSTAGIDMFLEMHSDLKKAIASFS
jgi:anti-anti-sigma factor